MIRLTTPRADWQAKAAYIADVFAANCITDEVCRRLLRGYLRWNVARCEALGTTRIAAASLTDDDRRVLQGVARFLAPADPPLPPEDPLLGHDAR